MAYNPIIIGGGTEATAQRVTIANDSTGVLSVDDNGGSLTVDASSLPLPTGAATAAAQTDKSQFTKITDGTDTALVTAAGEVNVLATAQPGVDIGDVTINNATIAVTQSGTWDEVGINDSGNSITVDNSGTFATQSTLQAGTAYAGKVRLTDGTTDTDVRDLANSNALNVSIVDGSGDQITSFGGGTQYTEGDTDVSITGTAMLMEGAANALVAAQGTAVDGLLVNLGTNNDVTVSGVSTSANQTTIIGHLDGVEGLLTTIDTDTGDIAVDADAIRVATELLDDTVQVLGTDTFTEASSKGITLGAVRRDADTTLVNTTNEFTPLQVDANGRLKVEAFSGETLPVSLTSTTITGTVAVTQSGTWDEVGINDSGNSITVDNGGTFAVQVDGSALTALQLIDDTVYTDDTSTHATGSSKGNLMMAAATPTDAAVNANDIGAVAMTLNRELLVQVNTALPAGTNGIGKLTANSGVDIGDVDVTSAVITGGAVAHDSADSGNPIKIGYKAETSPKGITLVADGDRTDGYADSDGMQYVKQNTSGADLISERVSDTGGTSTAFTNFSAVASTKNYITGFSVFRTDAGTTPIYVDFRDGAAGSVLWSAVIPAGGGANNPPYCAPALFKTSANTALAYDVSAATTTVYISVSGYQSKV